MDDCPGAEVLDRLLGERLSEVESEAVSAHVQDCPACQDALEKLTAAPAGPRKAAGAAGIASVDAPVLDRLIDRRPIAIRGGPSGPGRSPADADPDAPELPAIAGFDVIREVGRGGMGVVYEAVELALGRRVALKVLSATSAGPTAAERFRREVRAAGGLHHTNIVPVFGAGSAGGLLYYAMQFIDGEGLDRLIDRLERARAGLAARRPGAAGEPGAAPTPPAPSSGMAGLAHARTAARIGRQVAEGLQYAHASGFLHRDIKPSNILLDADGTAWVADFGLAKSARGEETLTHTGDIVGTLRYLPPERLSGRSDARGDVYALGATLYELLTLRPVFDDLEQTRLIERVLSADPIRPRQIDRRVPRDLETIVLKAMAKEPARRYATAGHLAEDLRRFLDGETIAARHSGVWERSARWARRRPVVAALLVAVMLLAASLLGVGAWSYLSIRRALGETAAALEIEARTRAEKERLSADLALDRGIALAEADQVGPGLLWMLRSIELAPPGADDLRRSARSNLSAWLDQAATPRLMVQTGGAIQVMAMSPDRRTVVTGHVDGAIRSWKTTTGRLLGTGRVDEGSVLNLAFRPDGLVVATVGPRLAPTVRLWDARSLRPVGDPLRHPINNLVGLAFLPDSRALVTFSRDEGLVRAWDATTGRPLGLRLRHPGVLNAAFSPDGRLLATAGRSREVRFWAAATGAPVGEPLPHPGIVQYLAISPDSRRLATIDGEDYDPGRDARRDGRLRVWDVATGRLVAAGLPVRPRFLTVDFHPDGRRVVASGPNGLTGLYDAETAEPLGARMSRSEGVVGLDISPDGRSIVAAGDDGTARLFDAATGHPLGSIVEHGGRIVAARFGPDGRSIVMGGRDGALLVWDGAQGDLTGRPLLQPPGVQSVEFSPDGRSLATASFDGTVRVFEVDTGRPIGPPMYHSGRLRVARFRPDGEVLATAGDDDVVRLWDVDTGRPLGPPLPHGHWVLNLRFSPDGRKLLAGRVAARAILWDLSASPRGAVLEHPRRFTPPEVWYLAFTRDGRIAITGDGEAMVGFWDAETGRQLGEFLSFSGGMQQLALDGTGRNLLVVARGRVYTVDCELRRVVSEPFGERIGVTAFSPDGRTLLSGGWEKTARLWDFPTGRPIGATMPHDGPIRGVGFSPDGATLATVTMAGRVRFWDAATSKPIGPVRAHPGWICPNGYGEPATLIFAPDGRSVVTIGGSVVVWPVPAIRGEDDPRTALVPALSGLEFDARGDLRKLDSAEVSRALDGRPAGSADPASPSGWDDRTAAYCERFGPPGAALWHLDRLVAGRPDDWSLRARRSRVHRLLGDASRAEADESRAIALAPTGHLRAWQCHDLQDRSLEAEDTHRWAEALALLDRLVAAIGDQAGLLIRRGDVHARLGRWAEAAGDLDAGLEESFPFNENLGRLFRRRLGRGGTVAERFVAERLVLYRLAAGDLDGYRDAVSRLRRSAPLADDPRRDVFLVYLLTLGPGGSVDPDETVRRLEGAISGLSEEEAHWARPYLGAAMYRAGRHAQAVARLEANGEGGVPRDWAFLAMAHHHLGHHAEARRWLDRLRARRPDADPDRFLDDLEADLFRREAEAVVLLDPAFPARPFAP